MKILVDAHIFDHSYQGTHTYIKGLYNAMVNEQDVEIYLCAHNTENLKTHFKDSKFKFVQLKSKSKWWRLGIELPGLCKKLKVDFAHFQYITPFFKTARFITTIHDILFLDYPAFFPKKYRFVNGFLFKRSTKLSDVVFTVSEFSKKALIKHFSIKEEKIFITPNAVTLNSTTIISEIKGLPLKYILYVSRFEPRKNQIGLLKIFDKLQLNLQGYHLVFVGSKKEGIEIESFEKLNSAISDSQKPFVHFLENLSPDELTYAYQHAECFVYPSFAEGFGIPPLEAAILQTKVLCSNTTAMHDFSFLKYQFNPNDQEEFEKQLTLILADKNYPYDEVKRRALELFNWEKIGKDASRYLKTFLASVKK